MRLGSQHRVWVETDGNFVVYSEKTGPWTRLWASNTNSPGGAIVMQGDGNLCLRGGSGSCNGRCNYSNGLVGDYYMILHDTGSLDIYRGTPANYRASTLVWTTLLDATYYNGR